MVSSLFGGVQKPNPVQSAIAEFINANKGKSPEQIASEHGIDINAIKRMFG